MKPLEPTEKQTQLNPGSETSQPPPPIANPPPLENTAKPTQLTAPNPNPEAAGAKTDAARPNSQTQQTPGNIPAVNFQALVQENAQKGQNDETHRLSLLTQSLQEDVAKLMQAQHEKEDQMRSLQSAMGSMQEENRSLRDENEITDTRCDIGFQF
ncbi:hypothetical protein KFL_005820060 [Klebsormidium nitens]|uniref:Uncharacterized protein n=1 Tax=Klebsormidium nitens TaxID=105231 RepID=A0A1Y1IIP7_KLENI|nr:hypothetical protein KFL_005820060 [Klebsormidium nitens]|eukprot:GAQ89962.1 hypothetical protein KFL_005820060 [Klebsormidium nitens]